MSYQVSPEVAAGIAHALELIHSAERIAVAGHVNPDGDALGSALALRELLHALGKQADIVLGQDTDAPELYAFLPNYTFLRAHTYEGAPDLLIIVDASTTKRLGTTEQLLPLAKTVLVIDHHTNYEGFTQHYVGDQNAPATASLIWALIKASGVTPTLSMAEYCYVALMTDTGRFAFQNTNHWAFADAMEMVDLGIDAAMLSQLVYESKSLSAMRIEALLIERMRFAHNGRVVYSHISQNDLDSLGVERDATEQLPTILRSLQGIEVALLFRDETAEGVRVNLRSRNDFDVGALALTLGGGGHKGAAGVTINANLENAIERVLALLETHYNRL